MLASRLLSLFHKIWEHVSGDYKNSLIVTIFYNCDISLCGNFSGITLIVTVGKALANNILALQRDFLLYIKQTFGIYSYHGK